MLMLWWPISFTAPIMSVAFIFLILSVQLLACMYIGQTKIYPKFFRRPILWMGYFCCSAFSMQPSVLWRCWLGGRKGIRPVKNWVVRCWHACLSGAMFRPSWCHCHLLSFVSVKSRLVLPFWYRPTRVVLGKGPLNGCVCVCVCLQCLVLFNFFIRRRPEKTMNCNPAVLWSSVCFFKNVYLSYMSPSLFAYMPELEHMFFINISFVMVIICGYPR